MSIRKRKAEIQRLIQAFEREADKFHDIKLTTFLFTPISVPNTQKFESPNHMIMLWQYYGKLEPIHGIKTLISDINDSNLQWGIRGAELSSFALIEGETCELFVRMAKRAGNLFNEKERMKLQTYVTDDIQKKELDGISKPTAVANGNALAIWLNYLLFYISKVNPLGKYKINRIEPEPYTLSLLALEQLLEDPIIQKVDKSMTKIENINFKVAFSFSGDKRTYVSKVVNILRTELNVDEIFYDFDYQSQLAIPNLDDLLQNIYRNNSDLIVVFLSKEYAEKEWCGLEWRAIKDIIKSKQSNKIMIIRFDNSEISGLFSTDGYIDANQYSENEISNFILERIKLSEQTHA